MAILAGMKRKNGISAIGKTGIPMLSGVIATFLVSALVVVLIGREIRLTTLSGIDLMLQQVAEIRSEGHGTIELLNQTLATECTGELLDEMRKIRFFADHIRDIGFVKDGNLVCSTGRGILEKPAPEPEPDYVNSNGVKFWSAIPVELYGRRLIAPLAEKGSFNVVYDSRNLTNFFAEPYHWEIVYYTKKKTQHVAGQDGIFREKDGPVTQAASISNHYVARCDQQIPFCVGVEVSNLALAKQHKGLIAMLIGASLMAGMATGLSTDKYLRWHFSTRNRIRRGLSDDAFYVLFQPIVKLETGEVVGCEVLARYRDHVGDMYPDEFIPLIAELNLTWPFTRKVIQQALNALEGDLSIPDKFRVNINLFPEDIALGRVRDLNDIRGLGDSRLNVCFEITEDQQLDSSAARENLAWMRERGWSLAVDDFGAGYSNLSHIRDLSCDVLKIDRSFINGIEHGGVLSAIVPMIVNLSEQVSLRVVAEGIENELQRDIVRDMGVAYGQGWFFGKPMSAEEFILKVVSFS